MPSQLRPRGEAAWCHLYSPPSALGVLAEVADDSRLPLACAFEVGIAAIWRVLCGSPSAVDSLTESTVVKTYRVPGTVLGSGDMEFNEPPGPLS